MKLVHRDTGQVVGILKDLDEVYLHVVQANILHRLIDNDEVLIWHEGTELGCWYATEDGDVCFAPHNPFDKVIKELDMVQLRDTKLARAVANAKEVLLGYGPDNPVSKFPTVPGWASIFVNHNGTIKPVIVAYRDGPSIILETP